MPFVESIAEKGRVEALNDVTQAEFWGGVFLGPTHPTPPFWEPT
jgi:hypothetical protein